MQIRISRWLTIGWGIIATLFALQMIGGSETVLELVNKIGSAFYGPVLAVFLVGIFSKRTGQWPVIWGLMAGITVNIILWQFFEHSISWLWWNVIGFMITIFISWLISYFIKVQVLPKNYQLFVVDPKMILHKEGIQKNLLFLIFGFIVILLIGYCLEYFFSR